MVSIGRVFEKAKLAVQQCCQIDHLFKNRTKMGRKCQNSNATFQVIFKQCDGFRCT